MTQSRKRVLLNALQFVVAQDSVKGDGIHRLKALIISKKIERVAMFYSVWRRVKFWKALLGSHWMRFMAELGTETRVKRKSSDRTGAIDEQSAKPKQIPGSRWFVCGGPQKLGA